MREIALDTETTGFRPEEGHRIVEIGAVEMINNIPTGKVYHQYINPERDMPMGAFQVHGLSEEFLRDYPTFDKIADDFLKFIGTDSKLVIHNAEFDMRFLNAEIVHLHKNAIPMERAFCTLKYARKQFPGSPATLDALCKRYGIDLSGRTKHGALLDAELLADMYLHLMGGPQEGFSFDSSKKSEDTNKVATATTKKPVIPPRSFHPSSQELQAHEAFLQKHIPENLWKKSASS